MAIGNSIGKLTPMINIGGKLQAEQSLIKINRELQTIIQRIQEDLNNLSEEVYNMDPIRISCTDVTGVAPGANGNIGWIGSTNIKYAKVLTLNYTANQIHHVSTLFSPITPPVAGYYAMTDNYPYHAGSFAFVSAGSKRFALGINDSDILFTINNASTSNNMDLTNIEITLRFD